MSDTTALVAALVDRAVVRRDPEPALGRARRVGRRLPALPVRARRATRSSCRCSCFVYFGVSQKPIEGKYRQTSILDLFQGITAAHPDWVDRAVGRDAKVTLIWSGNTDKYSVWENEFFNRSVRHFYYTTSPLAGDLPGEAAHDRPAERPDARAGRQGRPRASTCSPTGRSTSAAGSSPRTSGRGSSCGGSTGRCARSRASTACTRRTRGRGATVTYTRLGCRGGSVVVTLQSDPSLFTKPTTVVASVDGREVARTRSRRRRREQLTRPARRDGRACTVTFTVSPTAVPKVVTKGQNPDPRELGAHFTRFTYSRP